VTPLLRRGLLPAKHLDRYRQIAEVLADEGLNTLADASGLSRLMPRTRAARRRPDLLTPEQHVRQALERLGVTAIKAGQALSTRTDIVPPTLATELRKLQDEVSSEPFEIVRAVVERELEQPLEAAFRVFSTEPIAAASIGQVHRAELPDGTVVAVKVQRPGVREQVETDLDIGLTQARWVADHVHELGNLDVVGLAEEFADAIRGELDYVREARSAERLWRAFADDETVAFPRVYWSHTTSRVLTLEYFEGVRMNRPEALEAAGFDRVALAQRGIDCYLRQIFEIGYFHADPHPGNFLAMPGNRVGFTDFGRVGTISEESRERFIDLLWAAVNRDHELATDTFLALSKSTQIDETALSKEVQRLIGKYHGRELGLIDPAQLFREILNLVRVHRLSVSNDFSLAIATLGLLEGVGTMLDPAFDFAQTATPFVERLMKERMRPEELFERFVRSWRRSGRFLESLPSSVDRLMRRASRGEIRVGFAIRDYQGLVDELHELVNRLAFALVVAALVIGASTLIGVTGVPGWLRTTGHIGLVLALGVTVWFFGSVITAHYRGRRRR
jgi:ubiquinone biosynthesis protein